jgi:hypothetical protein
VPPVDQAGVFLFANRTRLTPHRKQVDPLKSASGNDSGGFSTRADRLWEAAGRIDRNEIARKIYVSGELLRRLLPSTCTKSGHALVKGPHSIQFKADSKADFLLTLSAEGVKP